MSTFMSLHSFPGESYHIFTRKQYTCTYRPNGQWVIEQFICMYIYMCVCVCVLSVLVCMYNTSECWVGGGGGG